MSDVASDTNLAREKAKGASYRLLQRLVASQGKVVTWDALVYAVYGDMPGGGSEDAENTLSVLICRLRKKLPPDAITNVWGIGYRLRAGVLVDLPPLDDARIVLALTPEDERKMRVAMRQARQAAGMAA